MGGRRGFTAEIAEDAEGREGPTTESTEGETKACTTEAQRHRGHRGEGGEREWWEKARPERAHAEPWAFRTRISSLKTQVSRLKPPLHTLKYFASGWCTTKALVDCSGSICQFSVSTHPMRSGSRSFQIFSWSLMSGQAG